MFEKLTLVVWVEAVFTEGKTQQKAKG